MKTLSNNLLCCFLQSLIIQFDLKDHKIHGSGILVYFRENIPARYWTDIENNIKGLFIKINLGKSKWPLFATHKPPSLLKELVKHSTFIGKSAKMLFLWGISTQQVLKKVYMNFQKKTIYVTQTNFQPVVRVSKIRALLILLILIKIKVFKIRLVCQLAYQIFT